MEFDLHLMIERLRVEQDVSGKSEKRVVNSSQWVNREIECQV
jgi:hypothetical protein